MNWLYVFIIPLLLQQSLGMDVDDMPRRPNFVTPFLNKTMQWLSSDNLYIPDINSEHLNLSKLVGKVDNLSYEIDGYNSFGFKLNATMNILITGDYEVDLDIPGLIPIFGKGKLLVAASELNLNTLLDAKYDVLDETFDIKLPVFDVDLKKSTVKLENLMNDPHLADFLNELLSNLIPDFVKMYKEELKEAAEELCQKYGNKILFCVKNRPFDIVECIREDLYVPLSLF